MPVEVILPKVDMDMATGRISRWYVQDGAKVKKGDVLFEIETDKAAMEIDAPASGTIGDIIGKEGIDIPVGEAVAWIYAEGEARGAKKAGTAAAASPAAPPAAPQKQGAKPEPKAPPAPPVAKAASNGSEKPRATPLARRIAADAGLKLATINGSGPDGRIMRQDVDAVIAVTRHQKSPTSEPASQAKPRAARTTSDTAPLNHVWLREGQGRPIVLIHGFGSDLNSWRPMLGAGSVDAPVLALDLPGHGASPHIVPADLDAIAADVEATITAAGVGPLTLVGHSFGGAVAASVAARGEADVRALALIAPAGLGAQINGDFLTGLVRARSEASLMPWLKMLVADEKFLTKAFVRATLAQAEDRSLRDIQMGIAARFFADGTQTIDIRGLIAGMSMPVRVIAGANDRIIPAHQALGLPGEVALHVFQATGHMPQIERAEAVLKIVLEISR